MSFADKQKRDLTPDLRERCSNCKRRIEPTEKVFRAEDHEPNIITVKGKLNSRKLRMIAELNKLNNAIYCPDCTEKFNEVISKINKKQLK